MFTFNGDTTKIYPNVIVDGAVLVAVPGQSYNVDAALDGDWAAGSAVKASSKAPVSPDSATEVSTDTSTPTN